MYSSGLNGVEIFRTGKKYTNSSSLDGVYNLEGDSSLNCRPFNEGICVFEYFRFDHFPKSKIDFETDLKWECPYFYSNFFLSVSVSI